MSVVIEEIAAPQQVETGQSSLRAAGFSILLLISGFCGISYEVLYGRILSNFVGDQFAISASILLTFMAGIGVGALHAHRFWRWLWLIEGAIGACAATAVLRQAQIETWFYAHPGLSENVAGSMAFCLAVLAIPSFLIGCSLPLFASYLRNFTEHSVFGKAYMAYNFGAALTVLAVEFVLLQKLGIRQTVLMMAGLNGMVSLALLICFGRVRGRDERGESHISIPGNHLAALILASIGSAVFQLLMVKTAECFLGPFRQTFALVLAVVLLGIAIGSALASRIRLSFGWWMVIALGGLAWLAGGFEWTTGRYAFYHDAASAHAMGIVLLKFGALLALMGVPAIAFGALIPALLKESDSVAKDSGKLLFVSSLANALGFLLMAFVLHRLLDYGWILITVAGFAALSAMLYARLVFGMTFVSAGLFALCVALLQSRWDEQLLYVGYDRFRSVPELKDARGYLKVPERFKGHQDVFSLNHLQTDTHFFINGYISIALNSPAEKIVGAFPALFAPRLDRALVLGVGSGATCGTAARLFEKVDAVEINPVVLKNFYRMREHNFNLASRTNVQFFLDDGVHFTKTCREKYPLIINTVTAPIYFSSSKLYTLEFLREIRRCLVSDGVYVTWVDARIGDRGLDIILKTVKESGFKTCALGGIKAGYFLLLCSDAPVRLGQADVVTKQAVVSNYFRAEGVAPEFLPYGLLSTKAFELIIDADAPVNTLDIPALEFQMAALDDRFDSKWATRLIEKLNIEELEQALLPALKVDPVNLALHTDRLYKDSPIASQRLRLLDQANEDLYERLLPAKLKYYSDWAEIAKTPAAKHNYTRELIQQKKYDQAIQVEQSILEEHPNDFYVYYNVGLCQEQKKEYDAALASYAKQAKMHPQDNRLSLAMGRVHYKLHRNTEALQFLTQACRDNDKLENHVYLSFVLKDLGREKEGEAEYQKGLKLGQSGAPSSAASSESP